MRLLVNLSDNKIIQVGADPSLGDTETINGKYVIDVPGEISVNPSSYVQPVDGGDVLTAAYNTLLALYPTFSYVKFNALMSSTDMGALDLTATYDNTVSVLLSNPPYTGTAYTARSQVGRASGPNSGAIRHCTALLPENDDLTPPAPGLLMTDTIDISAETGGLGADTFMVWWKVHGFTTSDDVRSSYGATSGQNDPAVKTLEEIDQEPSTLTVGISNDDGITFTAVNRLTPLTLGALGTNVRLIFLNTDTSSKIYLTDYAVCF